MMDTGLNGDTHTEDLEKMPNQTGSKQSGPQMLDTVATVTVTTNETVTDGETSPALNSQKLMISAFSIYRF